ncbi:MAG TPA: hypothetical protein DCL60_08550 [Armatimonadetes bacterium]|nr:hypothetical protein [Armatimonadota bacterium]
MLFVFTAACASLITCRPVATYAADVTVYITKTGRKYHADGCRSLLRSRIPISKTDAAKRGYTPCKNCKP